MSPRVLSFDGGGPLAITNIVVLRRLEKARPGFLAGADILAGTSAGAVIALYLAATRTRSSKEGLRALDLAARALKCRAVAGPGALLRGAVGVAPIGTPEVFRDTLFQHFGDSTLGDLNRKVVVPTFALHTGSGRVRSWRPKVWSNWGGSDDPDWDASVVDVLLATTAVPIVMPIHDDQIDGGIYANNPAMCALTVSLNPNAGPGERDAALADLQMFSVGIRPQIHLDVDNPNWGWGHWMLDRRHPMALIEACFEADSMATHYFCRRLLGSQYFRLLPQWTRVTSRHFIHEGLWGYLEEMGKRTNLRRAVSFLRRMRWGKEGALPKGVRRR